MSGGSHMLDCIVQVQKKKTGDIAARSTDVWRSVRVRWTGLLPIGLPYAISLTYQERTSHTHCHFSLSATMVTTLCLKQPTCFYSDKGCEAAVNFYSKKKQNKKQWEYPTQHNTEEMELWIAVNITKSWRAINVYISDACGAVKHSYIALSYARSIWVFPWKSPWKIWGGHKIP